MTIGEKIRFYRELRGYTQAELANSASIPLGTFQKYEINNRNPKDEQLDKIANVLNISIHALKDINIVSIDDIAPYLIAISKIGKIEFTGSKDPNGKYVADDLKFSFQSAPLQHFMKEWADKKEVIDKLREDAENSPDEQTRAFMLNRADEIEREIELRMIDSQLTVEKEKKK